MEYRDWGYDARDQRDPRDNVAASPPWSAAEEEDGDRPAGHRYRAWNAERSWEDRGDDDRWSAAGRWPESGGTHGDPGSWPGEDRSEQPGWAREQPPGDQWSDDRWPGDRWSHERAQDETGHATGAWAVGEHTGSWPTGRAWTPHPRNGKAEGDHDGREAGDWRHYAADYPPRSGPGRSGSGGRILDHDDWYEHPGTAVPSHRAHPPAPVPRHSSSLVHRPRPAEVDDADDDEPPEQGYLSAVMFTLLWYTVPVVLYVMWALTLGGQPEPGCEDPSGAPCGAPRTEALSDLIDGLPRLATALGLSLVVALVIRWSNALWRGLTVGFASGVVGAGVATVVFSLLARGAS